MLEKLTANGLEKAKDLYSKNDAFFPLIASVLSESQIGVVFGDDKDSPEEIYTEHSFGFAQIFGKQNEDFESSLKRYFLIEKNFLPQKVRLYTPRTPLFISSPGVGILDYIVCK
ncbi:MAG: hypothetical protein IJU76_05945 [Desulfovibrionaceae bacterium]|nr:hypothetical protein [Desulfovibrionaceae bacterium]